MSKNWGQCIACKWWAIEPDASVKPPTIGVCIDKELQPYQIRINGAGGCTRFQAGEPKRREGASENPPSKSVITDD